MTPENRVAVREAVEGLGMSWEVVCGMVRDAADARRVAKDFEAGDGPGKAIDAGEGYGHGSSGEESDLTEGASQANGGEGASSGSLRNGDGGGNAEVLGAQDIAGSTCACGASLENSAIESALAGFELGDAADGESFSVLEDTAYNAQAVRSMKGEALSRTIAAAMVNFDDGLRSDWHILATSLRIVFRTERIGGDTMVGCPEGELGDLFSSIVDGLRSNEAYRKFGDRSIRRFEQRLQLFLQDLAVA